MSKLAHKELWERYKLKGDLDAKNELIMIFTKLVPHHARKLARKSPHLFDYEDLIQSGTIGLIQAIEKFDITRNVKFETFASLRISGSMIDDINSLDWTPRGIRGNIKTYLQAVELHHFNNQEPPTDEDLSKITERDDNNLRYLSPEEITQARHQSKKTYLGYVDTSESPETASGQDEVVNSQPVHSPEDIIHGQTIIYDLLRFISENLTPEHLHIVKLKYYEGKTLKDISEIMGTSQTKVAKLHKQAIENLQEHSEQLQKRFAHLEEEK